MAAKHDAKKARANMWVTHQNLARAKGGRPGFQFQPRPPRPPAPAQAKATPAEAPAPTAPTPDATPRS